MPNYQYTCPECGTRLSFNKRVTMRQRNCPHCGHEVTVREIDRQEAARQRAYDRHEAMLEEEERRQKRVRTITGLVGCGVLLSCCCGVPVFVSQCDGKKPRADGVIPFNRTAAEEEEARRTKAAEEAARRIPENQLVVPAEAAVPDGPKPLIVRQMIQAKRYAGDYESRAAAPGVSPVHASQYAEVAAKWNRRVRELTPKLLAERAEKEQFARTLRGPEAQRKFPVFGTMKADERKAAEKKQDDWIEEQVRPELERIANEYKID